MVAQDNRIHALWDEIVRYRADEADDANRHLLRTLSGWIGATHAAWAGTVRILDGPAAESDPLYGWRGKALVFEPPFPLIQLKMARILLARYGGNPSLTAVAMARRSGTFRVNRLRDGFIDLAAFQATEHYIQHYQNLKVNDRLYIGCPVSPMAESYYIFDKRCTSDVFTEADAELAAAVVRGLTGFQLSMLLSHGIGLARSPLTATERRVVQFLLTSKLEKQIAAELGQSPNIAEAAKIPDSVWSMDARAGAVTEALEAGAEKTDVQRAATHSSAAMTERYDRKSEAASLAVAGARRKARTGRE